MGDKPFLVLPLCIVLCNINLPAIDKLQQNEEPLRLLSFIHLLNPPIIPPSV